MSQESVVALLERVSHDPELRERLAGLTSEEFTGVVSGLGFDLSTSGRADVLSDFDLDGIASAASDRTCYGTTDCCPNSRQTCAGTTDCCRR
jgi:hypothetical protein